eukprot:scaffold45704_cov23-Phaeocystis_antarctica.AAC.1
MGRAPYCVLACKAYGFTLLCVSAAFTRFTVYRVLRGVVTLLARSDRGGGRAYGTLRNVGNRNSRSADPSQRE